MSFSKKVVCCYVKITPPMKFTTTSHHSVRMISSFIMSPFSTTRTATLSSPKTGKVSKNAFYLENAMALASINVEPDVLNAVVARKLSFRSVFALPTYGF